MDITKIIIMISIIVTITFTNTRGNRAAVIKHGPRTSTPCILPTALVFIFASTSSTTSNLLLSATRVPRCRTQQPCRPVGVTCKPNVYPVLTSGSSAAAQPHPLAARRDSPAGLSPLFFAVVYLHRFCKTVIISPGCPSNQYASLSSILLSDFKCLPFSLVTRHNSFDHIGPLYFFVSSRLIKLPGDVLAWGSRSSFQAFPCLFSQFPSRDRLSSTWRFCGNRRHGEYDFL